ncbi:sensor histidine kinase [Archangium gephyra]|uniref:sensor histidine kinase n=1 Tax=Archangium gephyra TaxID=48 RepID=UPI003B7FC7F7
MPEGLRPLRAVLWRALLLSSVLALAVMGGFFVLFSYDLEDVIFDRLVAAEADRQEQALTSGQEPPRPAVGMSVHRGHVALPAALAQALSPVLARGEYEVAAGEAGHFHVAVRPRAASGDTLYVAFRANTFTRTTSRLLRRGDMLASSAALALLAAAVISSRVARRLSGPLEGLRRSLQSEGAALPGEDGAVAEVHALLEALRARDARIQALLERERQFNRDASHELRTPLAVAQGAVEILERHPPRDQETFARLRDAVHQMGLLTEGILWLARERRTGESCRAHLGFARGGGAVRRAAQPGGGGGGGGGRPGACAGASLGGACAARKPGEERLQLHARRTGARSGGGGLLERQR